MTAILGISAFYHDSAAALVVDGEIVAAAQQERFSRRKHDERFPQQAIEYCLHEAGITAEELDYVGFYEKPLLKFDRLLQTSLATAPAGFWSFARAMPHWLKQKLHIRREIRNGLNSLYKKQIIFLEHHESHAASAFFPSPFNEAAILTIDGVGEWSTATLGTGCGNRITLTQQLRFPHSLGLLYSAFTSYCGFRVNSGEYKLMGLAPYGEPNYAELIRKHLIDLRPDGSFCLNMRYFNYCRGLTMTSRRFHHLFEGPPRKPEATLTQREMDLAASIQQVTEEIVLRMAKQAKRVTGLKNLCLAGGVVLNCVANGRLLREGPFDRIWIQPAAGDAGGALGTAFFIWYQLLKRTRTADPILPQSASCLGPEFSSAEVTDFLSRQGAIFEIASKDEELCRRVAKLIADGRVVGWMQGRMEFGPRALGNRSILADPRDQTMQSKLNRKIKFRESFRPFAPSVLVEHAPRYFNIGPEQQSPDMMLVADVHPDQRIAAHEVRRGDAESGGFERLKQSRSTIPAVTHVDNSARLQTVDPQRHPLFHQLISEFECLTGCPLLINTSFNIRGEPIVCTPQDAYRCFMGTNMDVLVIGRTLLFKDQQPNRSESDAGTYLKEFELD